MKLHVESLGAGSTKEGALASEARVKTHKHRLFTISHLILFGNRLRQFRKPLERLAMGDGLTLALTPPLT